MESGLGAEAGVQPIKHLRTSCQASSSFSVLTSSLECFRAALRQGLGCPKGPGVAGVCETALQGQCHWATLHMAAWHSSEGCGTGSAAASPSAHTGGSVLKARAELVTPVAACPSPSCLCTQPRTWGFETAPQETPVDGTMRRFLISGHFVFQLLTISSTGAGQVPGGCEVRGIF